MLGLLKAARDFAAKALAWVCGVFAALWCALQQFMHRKCSRLFELFHRLRHSLPVHSPHPKCPTPEIAPPSTPTDDERKALLMAFASYFATEWIGGREHIEQ